MVLDGLIAVLFMAVVFGGFYVLLRLRMQRIRARRLADRIIAENGLDDLAELLGEMAARDPQVRAIMLRQFGLESDSESDGDDPPRRR